MYVCKKILINNNVIVNIADVACHLTVQPSTKANFAKRQRQNWSRFGALISIYFSLLLSFITCVHHAPQRHYLLFANIHTDIKA